MRVAIFVTNPKNIYSGGRYLSLVLAECLAKNNHEVYYITNNSPLFLDDFNKYENHKHIKLVLTNNFKINSMGTKFDFVIIIPHQNPDDQFYNHAKGFARETDANLVLFNFESPNWFNKYAEVKRDEKMWEQWLKCCNEGCLVLNMTKEGQKYSEEYYTQHPSMTYFDYWYPCINSEVADEVQVEKEKRIVIVSRLEDKHKGSGDILNVVDESLSGYTLVFILGRGKISDKYKEKLDSLRNKYGINYELKYKLNDKEKFREIKRAQLMLFPSRFEGYGYPPIEAQYCGTLCIAYDLPVLRETCREGIIYADLGNIEDFKIKIKEAIKKEYKEEELKKNVYHFANLQEGANNLEEVLLKYVDKKFYDGSIPREALGEEENTLYNGYVEKAKKIFTKLLKKQSTNEVLGGVSECIYHKSSNYIKVRGWTLSNHRIDEILILDMKNKAIGSATMNEPRLDIYEKYTQYNNKNSGWSLEGILTEDRVDSKIIVVVKSEGKALKKLKVNVKKQED